MASRKGPPPKPYYEQISERLIEQLEKGTAPLQRPWESGAIPMPYNPTTGASYKGSNSLWLAMQGREDPRWLTYKQAQTVDAQVMKGERGTGIEYWKFNDRMQKRDGSGRPVIDGAGQKVMVNVKLERPKMFRAVVFNAEQVSGLPRLEPRRAHEWAEHDRAEAILKGSGASLSHDQDNRAFYRPSTDSIHLPAKEQFPDPGRYYSTALHELGHWTGHGSRLDRDLTGRFRSEAYAKEELRAEISSLMVGSELGIGHDPEQHAAYVGSWIKALREDPKEILRASRDADKIRAMVMSYEPERDRDVEKAVDGQSPVNQRDVLDKAEQFAERFTNDIDRQQFMSSVRGRLGMSAPEAEQKPSPERVVSKVVEPDIGPER